MTKYNKAFVALFLAGVHYVNTKYGVELPIGDAEADAIVGLIVAYLVWQVPNFNK